jgi:cell division protein FtsB
MNREFIDHSATIQWPESKNLIAGLAHLAVTKSNIVDTFATNLKQKWVTTKQTIEVIFATIEWWASTRIYCDKDVYKGMYQKLLAEWTILKHQIEHLNNNIATIQKKPKDLYNIINFYHWLSSLLKIWERKIQEASVYPEAKIWFDTKDWNKEMNTLLEKDEGISNVSKTVKNTLYMNNIQ